MSDRLTVLKTTLWTLVGVLAAVTVIRFAYGLGAVTHLSDAAPWGLWIGFDVMSGVALAAGGFVLAATVHIFGLKRYRSFLRPAILTAMLGYAAVAVGLLYDLGLPWRIWHPLVHWQHRSVLFEVAMCVMLYLTVLTLEFAPAVLEHPRLSARPFQLLLRGLRKLTIPLVITGIVLSTLHQSSLGSLFLITPYRLHPLWYSHIIYVLFFVSAVGLGLMMVTLESLVSAYFLGHEVHVREVGGLGLAASIVLWIYLALRLGDLALGGRLSMAVDGSWQGVLFLFELGLGAVLPATLLLFPRVRQSLRWLGACAAFTVSGMILYRLDVSILAFARPQGFGYFPSWEEFAVSLGIVAAFALIFIFFVERFRVYDDVGAGRRTAPRRPSYDPATLHALLPRRLAAPRRYTAALLTGALGALIFLPVGGGHRRHVPTFPARTVEGIVRDRGPGPGEVLLLSARQDGAEPAPPEEQDLLLIDGNRDGNAVLFNHDEHVERLGGEDSCGECHHINLPFERASACYQCHRDMYDSTAVFDHASHVAALEGNAGCTQCHTDAAVAKTYQTATACMECHQDQVAHSTIIAPPQERWRAAASYTDAMHNLCVRCHEQKLKEAPREHPEGLDQCRNCHDADRAGQLRRLEPSRAREPAVAGRGRGAVPGTGSVRDTASQATVAGAPRRQPPPGEE